MTRSAASHPGPSGPIGEARRTYPPLAVIALALVNLVPFLGLLSAVDAASAGTVSGGSLLPALLLPTAVAAARGDRRWYTAQLAIASVVCFAVIGVDPHSTSARLVWAVTTVGTLVLVVLLIANGRRRVDVDLERLRTASSTDPLTGALNRRGFEEAAAALIDRAREVGMPIGVAAIDLDYFKRINDTAGHDVGDAVLIRVADLARTVVGDSGEIARSGGEEFIIVVAGDVSASVAALRAELAASRGQPAVTISVGMITADPDDVADLDDMWAAVDRADQWLYSAKAAGRDRIADGGRYRGEDPAEDGPAEEHIWADDDIDARTLTDVHRARQEARRTAGAAAPEPGEHRGSRAVPHAAAPRAAGPARGGRGRFGALALRWRELASRSRDQRIDGRTRLLYQLIVAWMVLVGMISTLHQVLTDGAGLAATGGLFFAGAFIGAVTIVWIRHMTNAWRFAPLAVLAAPFEMLVVFTLPVELRPPALMLVLLAAYFVVTHWSGVPMLAQCLIVAVSSVGAAISPGRPAEWLAITAVINAAPLILAVVLVGAIRSQQQRIEDELRRQAMTDPLTGLGNRRALDESARQWPSGQLVMVDVDDFKALNDRYGHTVGDLVLRGLAETLTRMAAPLHVDGRAFRIGGDEFVIAGPDLNARAMAGLLTGVLPGLPVPVSVTTGSASWQEGDGLWQALQQADQGLLDAKRARQR